MMTHECSKNPEPKSQEDVAGLSAGIREATGLWFPAGVTVRTGNDGKWYLQLNDEFAVAVGFCPFCGECLAKR